MTYRFSNRIYGCLLTAAAVLALTQAVSFAGVQLGQVAEISQSEPQLEPIWRAECALVAMDLLHSCRHQPEPTNGQRRLQFGQSSHSRSEQIWFLAGTFGGPADRTCTAPGPGEFRCSSLF